MKFSDLLAVKTLCDSGSLRKASGMLGVTPAALGHRITELESLLGTQLFERGPAGSEPTEFARFIARRVAGIADEASSLSREIERVGAGRSGVVRVGLGPAVPRVVIAQIVATLHERHPDVCIEIELAPALDLFSGLLRRQFDLIASEPAGVHHDAIVTEPLPVIDKVRLYSNRDAVPLPATEQVRAVIHATFANLPAVAGPLKRLIHEPGARLSKARPRRR